MAAMLKVPRHIRNPTPSVDAYLFEEQSCKISSRSDSKQRSLNVAFITWLYSVQVFVPETFKQSRPIKPHSFSVTCIGASCRYTFLERVSLL